MKISCNINNLINKFIKKIIFFFIEVEELYYFDKGNGIFFLMKFIRKF